MKEVKVKWIDSCHGSCDWEFIENFKPSIAKPTTYGFIIYEDNEIISIAQTYAEGNDNVATQINGVMNIPKVAILEMKEL